MTKTLLTKTVLKEFAVTQHKSLTYEICQVTKDPYVKFPKSFFIIMLQWLHNSSSGHTAWWLLLCHHCMMALKELKYFSVFCKKKFLICRWDTLLQYITYKLQDCGSNNWLLKSNPHFLPTERKKKKSRKPCHLHINSHAYAWPTTYLVWHISIHTHHLFFIF